MEPDFVPRFFAKVKVNGDCWEWIAYRRQGYARFHLDGGPRLGHRVAYEYFVGPIPEGLSLDHLCRNRACVNPYHLEPVPWGENTRRGEAWVYHRSKTHCPRNHPYAGDNLVLTSDGRRRCRICVNTAHRASQARRRAARNADVHAGRRFTDKEVAS